MEAPIGKSAPEAPDPKETAAAQTSTNLSTAQANAVLGNVNQVTPYGNLTYDQTGSQFISDPNGAVYWRGPNGEIQSNAPGMVTTPGTTTQEKVYRTNSDGREVWTGRYKDAITPSTTSIPEGWSQVSGYYVPQYTATTTLSEPQQAILDQTQAAQLNLAETANERSNWLQEYLKNPLTLESANATREQSLDALMQRLQPSLDAADQANQVALNNAGIKAGSTAYDRSRDEVNRNATDARLAAILASGQEAANQYQMEAAARNQPLNEIIGLMSGSQVQQPNFVNSNMPTIPTVDYAGLVQQDYQNQLAAWQQQNSLGQSLIGGLFGLGSAFLGNPAFLKSDIRTKKNIDPVGTLPNGLNVYRFHYVEDEPDDPKHIGVMAQEVLEIMPEAVAAFGGTLHVNYERVLS